VGDADIDPLPSHARLGSPRARVLGIEASCARTLTSDPIDASSPWIVLSIHPKQVQFPRTRWSTTWTGSTRSACALVERTWAYCGERRERMGSGVLVEWSTRDLCRCRCIYANGQGFFFYVRAPSVSPAFSNKNCTISSSSEFGKTGAESHREAIAVRN
jgi:hypothetical protein